MKRRGMNRRNRETENYGKVFEGKRELVDERKIMERGFGGEKEKKYGNGELWKRLNETEGGGCKEECGKRRITEK